MDIHAYNNTRFGTNLINILKLWQCGSAFNWLKHFSLDLRQTGFKLVEILLFLDKIRSIGQGMRQMMPSHLFIDKVQRYPGTINQKK